MPYIFTAFITGITMLISAWGVYNYVPLRWLENEPFVIDKIGATITNIAATDTLRDSRAVINTNFTNLNTDKIEVSTTTLPLITTLSGLTSASSLATIGTILTGIWNGTVIATLYGGTGSTTWPTDNTILYASSTNSMLGVPIGTVDQVLKLVNVGGSAGLVPQWSTTVVNQTEEYDWTGLHDFTSTTTFQAGTDAVLAVLRPLVFSGAATSTLNFTSSGAQASSTIIAVDANGAVAWLPKDRLLVAEATSTAANTTATTTLFGITIHANTFTNGNQAVIKGRAHIEFSSFASADETINMTLVYGSDWVASTSISNLLAAIDDGEGMLDFYMVYDGTNQTGSMNYNAHDTNQSAVNKQISAGSQDHSATVSITADQLLALDVSVTPNAGTTWTIRSVYAEISFR